MFMPRFSGAFSAAVRRILDCRVPRLISRGIDWFGFSMFVLELWWVLASGSELQERDGSEVLQRRSRERPETSQIWVGNVETRVKKRRT